MKRGGVKGEKRRVRERMKEGKKGKIRKVKGVRGRERKVEVRKEK